MTTEEKTLCFFILKILLVRKSYFFQRERGRGKQHVVSVGVRAGTLSHSPQQIGLRGRRRRRLRAFLASLGPRANGLGAGPDPPGAVVVGSRGPTGKTVGGPAPANSIMSFEFFSSILFEICANNHRPWICLSSARRPLLCRRRRCKLRRAPCRLRRRLPRVPLPAEKMRRKYQFNIFKILI